MDTRLPIIELGEMLGVIEDTVIKWKIRGTNPRG